MKWLNFSDDIIDNIEIQVPLDVYRDENQYSMISSFRKKKDRKRISSDINDYQSVLIDNTEISKEDQDISIESLVKEDNDRSIGSVKNSCDNSCYNILITIVNNMKILIKIQC
jgi:hypothetical protein